MSSILVTGGAGFIGSHTCVELLEGGYDVVVVDNLSNSCQESLNRVEKITGKAIKFYEADIADKEKMNQIFDENDIFAVIHFAGLKAVGESVQKPLEYYTNNIAGTLSMCEVMRNHNVKNIIFSSSATVYGWTKSMLEQILMDIQHSDPEWNVILLRYFNPIGAHKSGIIGEDPNGIPNNLMPYITKVATGQLPKLNVFGNDYPTPDGTGVRDYIHVVDLSIGHVKALEKIKENPGTKIYNLGTGKGYSVLEVVENFKEASGVDIPYEIAPRRAGDIAECYADPSLAKEELGWEAQYGIREMCADSWNWQKNNPKGYR